MILRTGASLGEFNCDVNQIERPLGQRLVPRDNFA